MTIPTLVPARSYAAAHGLSPRQVQRYADQGRLPGAVKTPGGAWLVPQDAPDPRTLLEDPTTGQAIALGSSVDTVTATSRDDGPRPRVVPAGLWHLNDVAAYLGTSVPGVRRLVADGHLGTIGPYGDLGGDRLYVAP
jgi:hypothetical protein